MNSNSMPNGSSATDRAGRRSLEQFAKLLFSQPGRVVELRALKLAGARGNVTASGYFDSPQAFVAAAIELDGRAQGVYATINEVDPALLARAANRIEYSPKNSTTNTDVVRRRHLLIDTDPRRPAGISSTDGELEAALRVSKEIAAYLTSVGFPEPARGISGNGGHLLYAIDLPAAAEELVEHVLRSLAFRFDSESVVVDTSVRAASQLTKAYGTMACKGDNIPARPHRRSGLDVPEGGLQVVPNELLRQVAAQAPVIDLGAPVASSNTSGPLDVSALLAAAGLDVARTGPWQGGVRWIFKICPFNEEHTNQSAYVVQHPSGALAAGCHHNSCQHWGWRELHDRLEPGRPRATPKASVGFAGSEGGCVPTQWPEPRPISNDLLPVLPVTPDMLPEELREWLVDVSDRIQCPTDYPAVGAIVALSSLIGRKVGICPKRRDDWLVVPNLWGAIVGRPGTLKTPALQEPLRRLRALEADCQHSHRLALQEHEAEILTWEGKSKRLERALLKVGEDDNTAKAKFLQLLDQKPRTPVLARHLVNDATVEKLGEILRDNPNGVLVFRDELLGLLHILDKEGREESRAFYLEGWDGKGGFVFDRIVRGTVEVPSVVLSLLGGIQPGPLASYLAAALRSGVGDDGLIQRFQLLVMPDQTGEWRNVDRWPDSAARNRAMEVYRRLAELTPQKVDAEFDDESPQAIPWLRFSADAQVRFDAWRAELEASLRSGADHEALESHFAKYRSLVPSLALIFHLIDHGVGPVALSALERAIEWAKYLESHARRIYGAALNSTARVAKLLATKITAGKVQSPFALRDVYQNGWAGLTDAEEVGRAAKFLVDLDWLAEAEELTRGRKRRLFHVNPRVLKQTREGTNKTGNSTEGSASDGFAGLEETCSQASVAEPSSDELPNDAPPTDSFATDGDWEDL